MFRKAPFLAALLAAPAALGLVPQAHAHNAWLLPSITVLSDTAQSVTVDAGASTAPFEANHAPMAIDNIKVVAPDGTEGKIENASRGRYRSTFDVRIDKPGTWRIGLENRSVMGTFKVNGEDWAISRRRGPPPAQGQGAGAPQGASAPQGTAMAPRAPQANAAAGGAQGQQGPGGRPAIDPSRTVASIDEVPANATDFNLTETQGRNEFFVTAGAPTDTVLKPTGKGLEFVPVTLPTDLVTDEPGKFRFLVDGKPAAGLKVELIPGARRFRAEEQTLELTTDANGLITVNWPVAGFYYLTTSLTDDKPSNPKANKRRMNYIATLEVVAP
ncbi:MAG: DUF4198 domain-containing protein [Novosphingobium sp.]|nr:DUF4198 domain-containing protein [Novosphingobium sp.]